MTASAAQFAEALQAISTLLANQPAQSVRVAIIGSTSFSPLALITSFIAHLPTGCIVISSRTGKVNQQALTTARQYGYKVEEFIPDWEGLGNSAACEKNNEIACTASIVVAFWDGQSPGTNSALSIARKAGVPAFIISPPSSAPRPIQQPLF
ncbi:hypothetical protein KDA_08030 [Dictyobacter alpinus]|uniref:DUF2493 domain-containing protein n=1 Tax=Dictyobacter alpinus TaxID=2014873 RepID=A0A402B1U4_9CHLR|nr:hypothetical protein [Dictyobacter alpinus]GCE25319.1 hypothetical protein KDA_08030 [Dictyobacter alpinus]